MEPDNEIDLNQFLPLFLVAKSTEELKFYESQLQKVSQFLNFL